VLEIVGDGQSAPEAAERYKPNIIVMDISMPVLEGVEACRRLRKILPNARVVLVTMHASAAYMTGAFQAGASGYMAKLEAIRSCARLFTRYWAVAPILHLRS
jgi:DNA-binding NarL/FixJ family response regulator